MHSIQMPKNCPICGGDKISKPIQQHQNNGVVSALFECDSCSVQFWEPLSRIDILKPVINKSHHKEFLKRHKDLPKNTKIIDFGCGPGELIGVLRKKGYDVWGVDQDGGAVKTVKKFFGDKNIYEMPLEEFFLRNKEEKFTQFFKKRRAIGITSVTFYTFLIKKVVHTTIIPFLRT